MADLQLRDYHVGIVCALKIEQAAMLAMLDEEYGVVDAKDEHDSNVYFAGRLHRHHVVVVCLPAGVDGLAAAGVVAKDMTRTFTGLRYGLLVGIGGGIPDLKRGIDIRLGDVVVSQPHGVYGGVVQYDRGKVEADNRWKPKGMLNAPPKALLTALHALQTRHEFEDSRLSVYLAQMLENRPKMRIGYSKPGADKDILYRSLSTSIQDTSKTPDTVIAYTPAVLPELREQRRSSDPHIHYGTIVSGNIVVKSASFRDQLREEYEARCVEMEAAGLMNDFPCLVIRGICDYADEYKNDEWHRYAAATAAAFTKELCLYISVQATVQEKPIEQLVHLQESIDQHFTQQERYNEQQLAHNHQQELRHENDTYRECHRAFKTSNYERHKNFNRDPVAGTCQWVREHKLFKNWAECSDSDLLWISADPGCGKSVLSKSIISTYLEREQAAGLGVPTLAETVCYFFFKDNETQDNLSTALCAILHQLFSQQPALLSHALPSFDKCGDQLKTERDELWRILQSVLKSQEARPIICVVDALDECRDEDRAHFVNLLCDFYYESKSSSARDASQIKWLITSRPYEDIQSQFNQIPEDMPSIRLRGEDEVDRIREEINLVIHARVQELIREQKLSALTEARIMEKLQSFEHRTYLWLHLVLDDIRMTLRDSWTPETESFADLPSTVEEAYEKILNKVRDGKLRFQVHAILEIIVGARQALSVTEMASALGMYMQASALWLKDLKVNQQHLREHIRQWCGLFIIINHDRLYLLHQTAKEFLLARTGASTSPGHFWKGSLQHNDVEMTMARICVSYICLEDFNQSERPIDPFFDFAAQHWAAHVRSIEFLISGTLEKQVQLLYLASEPRYKAWASLAWKNCLSYYYVALLDSDPNAVIMAAINGHIRILRQFIEEKKCHGPNVDGYSYGSALARAAIEGHDLVVELLANNRADLQITMEDMNAIFQEMAANGNENICQLLLDAGAEVNSGNFSNSALQRAARHGHERIVKLLLGAGADVHGGGNHSSIIGDASRSGHQKIVQMLLDAGADVNAAHVKGTALHLAAEGGNIDTIKLLLDVGADVHRWVDYYGTAFASAACYGHKDAAQVLLEAGAKVSDDDGYCMALTKAAQNGHVETARFLLDAGADVNAVGKNGTALEAASASNNEEIVQLLLAAGASVKIKGKASTALQCAAHFGCEGIVQLLIDAGADVNEDGPSGPALHRAAGRGHVRTVQMLLDAGADINILGEDDSGSTGTALSRAAEQDRKDTLDVLIKAGALINKQLGGKLDTAVLRAAHGKIEDTVQMLMDAGAEIDLCCTTETDYIIGVLASHGHKEWAQTLLNDRLEGVSGLFE